MFGEKKYYEQFKELFMNNTWFPLLMFRFGNID